MFLPINEFALADSASSGLPAVVSDSVRAGGALTVNVSGISDTNGNGTYTYQWQILPIGSSSWENISRATGLTYTLPTSNWNGVPMLRVSVVHTDGLGYIANLISPPFVINQNPTGEPFVMLVGTGAPAAGKMVSVNTDNIVDSNNAEGQKGTYTYQWQDNGGNNKGAENGQEYELTQTDVNAILLGNPPKVLVTLTDNLGFRFGWEAEVRVVDVSITQNRAQLNAEVDDPGEVVLSSSIGYQWQQSATNGGTYTNIPRNATSKTYTIPFDYGITHPFVRVSVSYMDMSSGTNVLTNVVSSPRRAAGVKSGTVGITNPAENVDVGDVINSDITNLRSVADRVPRPVDLTYQWYKGDGTTWSTIDTNGNGVSYAIAAADFDNDNQELSLQITDRAGLSGPFNSQAIDLQRDTTGNAVLSATESRLSVGATLNANTSSIADANGNGTNAYAWYYVRGGAAAQRISGASNNTLVIGSVPSGSGALRVIVSLTHTDALSFQTALPGVEFALTDSASDGALAAASNMFYAGGKVTAITAGITDNNGAGAFTYQWQRWPAVGSAWENIGSSATDEIYTFPASGWGAALSLRVTVVHTDGLGYTADFVSPPLAINENPTGEPFVMLVGGGAPEAGKMVIVNTSNIADINNTTGQGTYAYQWQNKDNTPKSGQINQQYILTADDVTDILAGTPPKVLVTLTDSLGFTQRWVADVRAVDVRIATNGAALSATVSDPGGVVLAGSIGYRWLQSATNGGAYTPISGVGNVASYTVPVTYGTSHPFVRVSVTYTDTSSGSNVATSAISTPLRVAGVASGTIGISSPLTNVGVGGVANSDISNLLNVLDRAVRTVDLTYQWYSGNGSTWTEITRNGNGTSYTIAAADFTNTRRQLSLQITDRAGSSGPFDSQVIDLQRDTTGNVTLSAARLSVGATVNTNTRGIADANGVGTYTYAWYYARVGGTPQRVNNKANSTLVIARVDLPSGRAALRVIVSVTHIDILGFETTLPTIAFALTDSDSSGVPAIDSNSVRPSGKLTANVDSITDNNGIRGYTYQWQQSAGGGNWTNITRGGSNAKVYTLPASGWNATPSVRVSVVHTDGLGYIANLISPPFAVNQNPTNEPLVNVVNNVVPIAGATLQVDVSNIRDANNTNTDGTGGAFVYEWQESTSIAKNNATDASYTLTALDIAAIEAGTPPQVEVTFTDNLGFVYDWTVPFNSVDVLITRTGANLQAAVDDRNDEARVSGRSYQWLQSTTDGGTYTPIRGATNNTYAVPLNYGTSHPFVRVSLDYFNTTYSRQTNVVSRPITVAGVASGGTVGIVSPTNVGVGGVIIANIVELTSILDRAVLASDLTYQWQVRSGSSFTLISDGATSPNYILSAGVFSNSSNELRLRVIDRVVTSNIFISEPVSINRLPTGELRVQGVQIRIGTTLTATRGLVNDANGVESIAYQWYRRNGNSLNPISNATNSTLILAAADFVAGVRVAVGGTVTDVLGFENTVAAVNARAVGDVLNRVFIINTAGYVPSALFSVQTNRGSSSGVRGINYQWQQGRFDANGVVQYTSIDRATGTTYNLVSLNANNYPLLRVAVTAATQTGQRVLLSPAVSVAQPIIAA